MYLECDNALWNSNGKYNVSLDLHCVLPWWYSVTWELRRGCRTLPGIRRFWSESSGAASRVKKRVSEKVLRRVVHRIRSETLGRRLASAKSLAKSLAESLTKSLDKTLSESLGETFSETFRTRQASPQSLGSDYNHGSPRDSLRESFFYVGCLCVPVVVSILVRIIDVFWIPKKRHGQDTWRIRQNHLSHRLESDAPQHIDALTFHFQANHFHFTTVH